MELNRRTSAEYFNVLFFDHFLKMQIIVSKLFHAY